jgi:hypothetical protein
MCDLYLPLYMFLYVYVPYPDNAAVKILSSSRMQPTTRMPVGGHQIEDTRIIGCVSYWFNSDPSRQLNRLWHKIKHVSY